jgi:hypothetical protein
LVNVRFAPIATKMLQRCECPLCANSGHQIPFRADARTM